MTSAALKVHGWYGNPVSISAARTFSAELYREAAELGIGTSLADMENISDQAQHTPYELLWDESRSVKGSAAALEAAAMVVTIFIGTAAASWAIEKVLDTLWDRLKPALRKLVASPTDSPAGNTGPEDNLIIQTYYHSRSVLVEIQAPLNGLNDIAEKLADADKESRAAAMKVAPGHVLRYVITDTTTYRIDVLNKTASDAKLRKDSV